MLTPENKLKIIHGAVGAGALLAGLSGASSHLSAWWEQLDFFSRGPSMEIDFFDVEHTVPYILKGLDDAKKNIWLLDTNDEQQFLKQVSIKDTNSPNLFFLHIANPLNNDSGARSQYINWYRTTFKNSTSDEKILLAKIAPSPGDIDEPWLNLINSDHGSSIPNWRSSELYQRFQNLTVHPLKDRATLTVDTKLDRPIAAKPSDFGYWVLHSYPDLLDLSLKLRSSNEAFVGIDSMFVDKSILNSTEEDIPRVITDTYTSQVNYLIKKSDHLPQEAITNYWGAIRTSYRRARSYLQYQSLRPDPPHPALYLATAALLITGCGFLSGYSNKKTIKGYLSRQKFNEKKKSIGFYSIEDNLHFTEVTSKSLHFDDSYLHQEERKVCKIDDVLSQSDVSDNFLLPLDRKHNSKALAENLLQNFIDFKQHNDTVMGAIVKDPGMWDLMGLIKAHMVDERRSPRQLIDWLNQQGDELSKDLLSRMILKAFRVNPFYDLVSHKIERMRKEKEKELSDIFSACMDSNQDVLHENTNVRDIQLQEFVRIHNDLLTKILVIISNYEDMYKIKIKIAETLQNIGNLYDEGLKVSFDDKLLGQIQLDFFIKAQETAKKICEDIDRIGNDLHSEAFCERISKFTQDLPETEILSLHTDTLLTSIKALENCLKQHKKAMDDLFLERTQLSLSSGDSNSTFSSTISNQPPLHVR